MRVRILNRLFQGLADSFGDPDEVRRRVHLLRASTLRPAAVVLGAKKLDARDQDAFRRGILAFRDRAQNALDAVVAGNVQLLGFTEVRRHFADKWDSAKQLAYQVIEGCIERSLSEHDLYVKVNDESYVILFGQLSRTQAELRSETISQEVTAALCASIPGGAQITVRGLAVELDAAMGVNRIASVQDLAQCLERAEQRLSRRESKLFDRGLEDARVTWWPTTNIRKRMVSLYHGELVPGPDSGNPFNQFLARRRKLADELAALDEHEEVADLARSGTGTLTCKIDCHMLEHAASAMKGMQSAHHKALIMVPVHYDTLAMRNHREAYIRVAETLPAFANRRLAPLLLDLPPGTPQVRLRQILTPLQPFSLGSLVCTSMQTGDLDLLQAAGVMGLVVDAGSCAEDDDDLTSRLVSFVARARQAPRGGFRTLLHRCGATALGQRAVRAGFDYLNGRAVYPSVEAPGRVFRLS